MTVSARAPDGLHAITQIKVRDASNTLRTLVAVKVRDASNTLRTVWQAMSAALSRATVDGYGDSRGAIAIATQTVSAIPAGGTAPYSYAWASTGGDVPTILNPASATTAFSFAGIGPGNSKSGTLACTVTDANGTTAVTPAVIATATNVNTA